MLAGPVQIAYAVSDVDVAAAQWVAHGVGPFFVLDHIDVHNVRIHQHPGAFDHSSAFAQWGDVMVELICQHSGGPDRVNPSTGVHHTAHFVDDFASASQSLTAAGAAEVLYAETSGGTPFAFHDARLRCGHYLEIYERGVRLNAFYDMVRAASIDWSGAHPIRRL